MLLLVRVDEFMENLIRDVIELDKAARNEVAKLIEEKEHISDFLREERKKIEKKYKADSAQKLANEKKVLLAELEQRKKQNSIEFEISKKALEQAFLEKKDVWIESIYQDCIKE